MLAVIDGQRMGFSRFGMYMLLFHCQAVGGELQCHPLECADVGWFARDALPEKTAGAQWWADMAFAAIDGEEFPTIFDEVRSPIWRSLSARRSTIRDRSSLGERASATLGVDWRRRSIRGQRATEPRAARSTRAGPRQASGQAFVVAVAQEALDLGDELVGVDGGRVDASSPVDLAGRPRRPRRRRATRGG